VSSKNVHGLINFVVLSRADTNIARAGNIIAEDSCVCVCVGNA